MGSSAERMGPNSDTMTSYQNVTSDTLSDVSYEDGTSQGFGAGKGYQYDTQDNFSDPGVNCSHTDDEQWDLLMSVELILGGYLTISVSVLGIISNILAMVVLCRKMFR